MTLCDIVGRLFQGVCKKGAVHHGLFLLGPPVVAAESLATFSILGIRGKVRCVTYRGTCIQTCINSAVQTSED